MNNNINIAELLKDCPKGTKLYSTIFGEVELKEVWDKGRTAFIVVTHSFGQEEKFYPDGKYNTNLTDSECTLFPSKEQRDWSKFCPFKDGDVLSDRGTVFIFNRRRFDKCLGSYVYNSHCLLMTNNHLAVRPGGFLHMHDKVSFASEKEKTKLFNAIEEHRYKWNAETKTLENLIEPKLIEPKLIEPKFKVGDRIVKKNSLTKSLVIIGVSSEYYELCNTSVSIVVLPITEQDDWELVPKRFDITALKPFDKVLVRNRDTNKWTISLFSHSNGLGIYKYSCINDSGYVLCIPYEGNEHLMGKTDDCDEYYKTWK